MKFFDLHRHDEFSTFDGFGKALDLAKTAKTLGQTTLGLSNHGNTNGLVEHYLACKEVGIKPILGVEAYFQTKFTKETKQRYHLCLFAKNLEGYRNINKIMTIGYKDKMYYKPIVDFELLEEYSEGIICTSACIAGPISFALKNGKNKTADKLVDKFVDIFGEDFYIEIQPYRLFGEDAKCLQEDVNEKLIKMAINKGMMSKLILTSDSHFGSKEDFDTYKKLHEIAGDPDMADMYKARYIPTEEQIIKRFKKMHPDIPKLVSGKMLDNMQELNDKVEPNFLEELDFSLPKFIEDEDSVALLRSEVKEGLIRKGKYKKEYAKRCKEELDIIINHGFEDYFLIVQDYVNFAKENGIAVGAGRGSVCNSLVAFALGITNVDSLYFDLDFRRFLREDKSKLPDIDLDFETEKRQEVIEYLVNKYDDKSVQICSYGLYRVDNLLNDLFKVCGVEDKDEQKEIKTYIKKKVVDSRFDYEEVRTNSECKRLNKSYDNIVYHFSKLYKQVRFIGTHAAGVAIVGSSITDFTAIEKRRNKFSSAYDLNNLEHINAVKFDILGLNTLSSIEELEEITGKTFDYKWLEGKVGARIYEEFGKANTDGIFQFESNTAKDVLRTIEADCLNDVLAASALNRPGPLSLGMPSQYAENKFNIEEANKSKYFAYTAETYGTIVYQEQLMLICRSIGLMEWPDVDRVMKMLKTGHTTEAVLKKRAADFDDLFDKFYKGAKETMGAKKDEALDLFEKVTTYSFNKGHTVGYTLISIQEMYYKIFYPSEFWYVKLKYANVDENRWKYSVAAVKQGNIILLPHVNGSAKYSLKEVDGEVCIQEGMSSVKFVGAKAAEAIEKERRKNGDYKDEDDFIDRLPKRSVNTRTVTVLKEVKALTFNDSVYYNAVEKYNTSLYVR